MKRIAALLLALVTMLSMTSAFAEEKTTVKVWCWDPAFNIYAIDEAAKIYEAENPNVDIVVEETASGDCETKQTVALSSGQTDTLPDIILMQDNSGRKFLNTFPGAYFQMDGLVDYDNFAQYKVNNFTYEDGHYAVPFDNGCAATFIRTDYLEEAGYTLADVTDVTWDQFIEIGKAVKEKTGKALLTVQAGYSDFIMLMTQSAATWFFDADGNPNIAGNPVFEEIVTTIKNLHDSGIVAEAVDWTEYIQFLNDGTAGSTIQGCWIIGSITLAEDQSGKWGVTNVPRLNCEGATNYSSQGGSSWVVPATSPNKEIAVDFLSKTFGGSVDFYQTILAKSGAIATYLPAAGGSAYTEEQPFFGGQKVFEDLMTYSASVPMVEYGMYNYEARDAVKVAVDDVINNGVDVATALQTAQETVEFTMSE